MKETSCGTIEYFNHPAVKMFAKQVQQCQKCPNDSSWLFPLKSSITQKEIKFPGRLLWLQGNIQAIINQTCIILKDSTGLVKVMNCDQVPTGGVPLSEWLVKGAYCSVIGELVSSGNGMTPVIQAAKITSLDDNPNLQSLWSWEVQDLANVLVDGTR